MCRGWKWQQSSFTNTLPCAGVRNDSIHHLQVPSHVQGLEMIVVIIYKYRVRNDNIHHCQVPSHVQGLEMITFIIYRRAWWLSGRVSDSGVRGPGFETTAAVLCPWARHFTPRKYWLITQEAVAPSPHDWKIVDWDIKPQHKQNKKQIIIYKLHYPPMCRG